MDGNWGNVGDKIKVCNFNVVKKIKIHVFYIYIYILKSPVIIILSSSSGFFF